MLLSTPLSSLTRVGQSTEKSLKRLGLENVQDLLFYFPFRYEDFTKSTEIEKVQAGDNVNIKGTIELIQNKRSPRQKKQLTEALVSDESGTIKVIWFNQGFLTKNLKAGDEISLAGKVSESYGQLSLVSPQYEKISSSGPIHTQGLIPVYHLNSDLTQKQVRFLIKQALSASDKLTDLIPPQIRSALKLIDIKTAINLIHFPRKQEDIDSARQSLGFAELFLRQLHSQLIKKELKDKEAPALEFQEMLTKRFVDTLAFKLTKGQKQSAWEILQDIAKSQPMSRLLEGDVGSGKTVVAAMAMLNVAANGYQSALMAPTEILSFQHYQTINNLLSGFNTKIALLSANHQEANFDVKGNKKEKTEQILKQAEIIIGTQALIQNHEIKRLALVVVDEQHRFGVKQRQKLRYSGQLWPHFLSMTATPIPRSLALSIYGDLDVSIIKEMPAGRKTTITRLIPEQSREQAYQFIRKEIDKGHQAFIICPLVSSSDKINAKSAQSEYRKLQKDVFSGLKLGLVHGKLKSKDKEKAMSDFAQGKTQILVASPVVEVGVDISNATVMLIESAERFGLAQLHQFRGRIGRGEAQSYCLLINSDDSQSNKAGERLQALSKYHDGLSLARIDLKLRGAGELYGLAQSGFPELRIASIFDYELIKKAQAAAKALIEKDPELKNYPELKEAIDKRGQNTDEAHLE